MKMHLGVALTAALLLSACAQPKPVAPTAAAADQGQVAADAPVVKKKRCSDQTGSRLAVCGEGSTGDIVQGSSGDAYRDSAMRNGSYVAKPN